ncbi:MbtH family protein [Streptomyces sp. NPDC046805]|uniref:MbtH family protein n=1 Tax=Streptomyces sp. NPDC046805 TaxID=3155134 RepID=UPI00340D0B60
MAEVHRNADKATNPFEDEEGRYGVVVNAEGQHSIWPQWLTVPAGWETVLEDATREDCRAYVETHWTDMRPVGIRDVV